MQLVIKHLCQIILTWFHNQALQCTEYIFLPFNFEMCWRWIFIHPYAVIIWNILFRKTIKISHPWMCRVFHAQQKLCLSTLSAYLTYYLEVFWCHTYCCTALWYSGTCLIHYLQNLDLPLTKCIIKKCPQEVASEGLFKAYMHQYQYPRRR